ncbi:tetrahydrofolate dehydrogenase/cyclohydrolase [Dunaliella salina]|uniref:methenyltetrahydrofolate cyclohydrolase n=1 Tax=Dunaliella salina TaxID=3046 RepID=A0ABQ7H4F9_DUNSA|nr:tetrahydrofolate dehydrogenase/cyclohydrolase [Dunaliella salina]|eukprot:KAF5841744.1 tetrahydrofolate dehydrogenase/cyclohydrolase [Dunaliella salina]
MSLMNGNIIDGKAVAEQIRKEIAAQVVAMKEKYKRVPGLAVVIVGERGDSQTYVRMKQKACEEVGIASFGSSLPASASQEEVLATVRRFNNNPDVHGILVQLPLPPHVDEAAVLGAISLNKDVDGFHPFNIGRLAMKGREPLFAPCTPLGCIALLDRCGIDIKGKRAVVVGRSNIVGMPVAMLLNKRDATVTICHASTKDMEAVVRDADIVVAACGRSKMVKGSWLKPGAAVIDVGTNPTPDATKKSGFKLVGDVDFDEAKSVAGAITPVPGGVGPMTITMLLQNTVESGRRFFEGIALEDAKPVKRGPSAEGVTPIIMGMFVAGIIIKEGVTLLRRIITRSSSSSSQ